MSLQISKSALEQAIVSAFIAVKNAGSLDDSDPNANIRRLASELTNAIHAYVTSAQVNITAVNTIVLPGIATPTGATTSPSAPAVHTGFGKLE